MPAGEFQNVSRVVLSLISLEVVPTLTASLKAVPRAAHCHHPFRGGSAGSGHCQRTVGSSLAALAVSTEKSHDRFHFPLSSDVIVPPVFASLNRR